MTVIVINCITLGSFEPCQDLSVCHGKCQVLKVDSWNLKFMNFSFVVNFEFIFTKTKGYERYFSKLLLPIYLDIKLTITFRL